MATFFVVATPIGNLEDVTLRALRVLAESDVILCEDTRVTRRLLDRHSIAGKKLVAYNEKRSGAAEEKVLTFLLEGKSVALVSDAGTPAISDPGARLVEAARRGGHRVVPIPGANAAVVALSASGLPASDFLFLGFLPHKKGRETLFKEISRSKRTVVFYESPHRIVKALESLVVNLDEKKTVVVARELTKIHEEFVEGSARDVFEHFTMHSDTIRGEFVIVVSKNSSLRVLQGRSDL